MDMAEREREYRRRLEKEGLLLAAPRDEAPTDPPPFEPIEVRGKPLSREIIEARR